MSPLLAAVLVFSARAPIHARPGGPTVATVDAGTLLEERGRRRGAWVPVEVDGDVSFDGWVRTRDLGCRLSHDAPLTLPEGRFSSVTIRRGAILRTEKGRKGTRVIPAGNIQISGEMAVEDLEACVSDGGRYWDRTPEDGDLATLREESALREAPDEEGTVAAVPAGTRFVVLESRDGWVRGYVDGPIVVRGWIPVESVGPPPEGSPIDILTRPLAHSHELLDASEAWPRAGAPTGTAGPRGARPKARLRGGTAVDVVETREGWVRVRTVGPVELDGWVPASLVREVTIAEEAIVLLPITRRHEPPVRGARPPPPPEPASD